MTTAEVLRDLRARDIRLSCEDGRLVYDAPAGAVTAAVLLGLREHKAAILEAFEERAAIMEYDAGMPRAEAEARAWRDVLREAVS